MFDFVFDIVSIKTFTANYNLHCKKKKFIILKFCDRKNLLTGYLQVPLLYTVKLYLF